MRTSGAKPLQTNSSAQPEKRKDSDAARPLAATNLRSDVWGVGYQARDDLPAGTSEPQMMV